VGPMTATTWRVCAARMAGLAWACPLFLRPGAAVVSGVKGGPEGMLRGSGRQPHGEGRVP
jgi:hypothetical protein